MLSNIEGSTSWLGRGDNVIKSEQRHFNKDFSFFKNILLEVANQTRRLQHLDLVFEKYEVIYGRIFKYICSSLSTLLCTAFKGSLSTILLKSSVKIY